MTEPCNLRLRRDAPLAAFFTSEVELPIAPASVAPGDLWWEPGDGGWLYPWRITRSDAGRVAGYPCGEPIKSKKQEVSS